jgi:hypothetical protein
VLHGSGADVLTAIKETNTCVRCPQVIMERRDVSALDRALSGQTR